jgi:hypothetical protein
LTDVSKNPEIAPISLALEIVKSTIEPLDNVIASFDRHQNRLLEQNIEKNGLREEDLKSLPQLAQTISYVSQRLMAMDTAIRYFDAYIEKLDGTIDESLRKKVSSQLLLLSGTLGIYERRCEALLNNIELLQDSMQIATQLESNRKNQMLSNRFTILAGGLGPVGVGLGFIQAYAITGTAAHAIFATSLVCGALLIAFRNCNIPWLDGPE